MKAFVPTIKEILLSCLLILCFFLPEVRVSALQDNYVYHSQFKWGVAVMVGQYTTHIFRQNVAFNYGEFQQPTVLTVSPSYTLPRDNWLSYVLSYIHVIPELLGNINMFRDLNHNINAQLEILFVMRYRDFPWNKWLHTSVALGIGPSYSILIPRREYLLNLDYPDQTRHFLNAVLFEITARLPQYPSWEVVYRINHRSGVFGLLTPGRTDINQVLFGLRYQFN